MQPDFTKLKPVDQSQPDFAKLSPAVQRVVNAAPQQSFASKVVQATDLPGASTVRGVIGDTLKNTYETYKNTPAEIGNAIQEGANTMSQGGVANFFKGAGQSALGTASAAVSAIFAPISSAFGSVMQRSGAQGAIEQTGSYIGNKISDIPAVQNFAVNNPNAEKYINQGLNVGMGVIGGNEPITAKGLKEATKFVADTTQTGALKGASIADSIYNSIKNGNPTDLDKKVLQYYDKGVRPSVAGKGTTAQLDAYNSKALQALDTIATNKPRLQLTNADGQVESKLPSSLNEFSQAIDQTKKSIFEQYDAMAKQSGEAGAQVNLEPIAAELDVIANDPKLKTFSPGASDYAGKLAERMRNQGFFNPSDIQDSIKMLNDKLQAFYRNPSPEGASNASIDAVMANKLRESLDSTIGSYTGKGYQELKNQYGALSTIEKDVIKRAIVDARKNVKGLLDFTDIASGAEAVHAILTTSPQGLATAGAMKAIKEYYKYLNDPNTSVNKLFKTIEKAKSGSANVISPSGKLQLPQSKGLSASTNATPFQNYVKNPKLGLSMEDVSKLTPQERGTLVAVHNTTANKLRVTDRIGGFANPSIAIFDPAKNGFENFGDITLISPKQMLKSRGAKTFSADVYSPRFPDTKTFVDYKALNRVGEKYGINVDRLDTENIYRSLENSEDVLRSFVDRTPSLKNKIENTIGTDVRNQMRHAIFDNEGMKTAYLNYVDGIAKEAGTTEKIWKGFTPSGNRRYADLTVENASKDMNTRDIRGGESFNYGLGSIRAKIAPELKNISSIKKASSRLISSPEFEKVKAQYENQFSNIIDELGKYSKYQDKDQFIHADNVSTNLGEYLAGDRKIITDMFQNVPQETLNKIEQFRKTLYEMPTEYFETKFKRPVDIGEFSHAIVPEGTDAQTIKLLKDKGVDVSTYKKGDVGAQTKKIMQVAAQYGLLFGIIAMVTPTNNKKSYNFSPSVQRIINMQ